ncbi:D-serine ammonia-lyase [Bacillus paranthracis]|uniref:Probable D-serine dehydratase n=2 Tax=Bacillus cereus group TaxID=86661 RepID=SDHD_BACC7|nr:MULTISPECIES: D-serine ammonia-lyase [Bacillus]B7HMG6.1 RecName: Full=Probable D-serine dehydratase; AltName: Full=D-serine deaminase; Short=DSD [Bacillus cereus AH187]EDZ58305.1 D-serine ammonia-lyase [Bacillus cereus H3081.97]EJP87534.1 D-serine ammonia-lyase [Bacillus cereus IS075]EJQ08884.1 D-serine ammonia-lyase [Bacillus cereus AND1407]EJR14814.1 D-serine ammonia-lyase [Bacillus cereus MSX-A12]EOO84222.1 D-serine ammonia-lyase [Bacillus cereus IS845/00]EOO95078.1 D-serine ammonia-ly
MKGIEKLKEGYPLLNKLIATEEVFWVNPNMEKYETAIKDSPLSEENVKDAEERLKRFASYIAKVFPETKETKGIIESPLLKIPSMKQALEKHYKQPILGELLLKCDSHLPISGSIKARGGIYEVLKHAEQLALQHGMLTEEDDYSILDSDTCREFFAKYSIAVGSTGNLGLSIGIMSAKLGFNVTVHMSADAKQWKKDLLRSKGVNVIEYEADYSKAVKEGRQQADTDPSCYFVDDENSHDLFLGYAVAASRLQKQLEELEIVVDEEHPLFVYLPCGVGGGPGGVAFGLKLLYKDNVHCFFAEPTHSPCMLLGLMTGLHDKIAVQDIGIDNVTDADGLAVGRPSGFVGKTMEPFLSGNYTVSDEELYRLLKELADTENIYLEPSALAGMIGPVKVCKEDAYLQEQQLMKEMKKGTHIVWGTGGSMVPEDVINGYYKTGERLTI